MSARHAGRGRQRGPTRCLRCGHVIRWITYRGNSWKFDPRPVDRHYHPGPPAYPIESGRAWHPTALVEELMGRREISRTDAEDEVNDMPWHTPHVCPPTTSIEEQHQ